MEFNNDMIKEYGLVTKVFYNKLFNVTLLNGEIINEPITKKCNQFIQKGELILVERSLDKWTIIHKYPNDCKINFLKKYKHIDLQEY